MSRTWSRTRPRAATAVQLPSTAPKPVAAGSSSSVRAISVRPRRRVGDSARMAGFLSDAERMRLNRFPAEVPHPDMIAYWG